MRSSAISILAFFCYAFPSASLASDTSMRCDGGLVSLGDAELDLLGKCGRPALKDTRVEERATAALDPQRQAMAGERTTAAVQDWTYNFGPRRFMYVVTVELGRIVAIQRAGYGYDPEQVRAARKRRPPSCDSSALRVGDIKLDLVAKCGEPATKDVRREQRLVATGGVAVCEQTVEVEVWTYDFGPRRLVHFVTLENGRVVAVGRGGYGYER